VTEPPPVGDPPPTPDLPHPGGATRAPLAEGEEPEASGLARAKKAYDLVSDVLSPKRLGLLAAVAAVLLAGLFGGWEQVDAVEKASPTVAVGATTAVGPFDVAIRRAYVATALPPFLPKTTGVRYLVVLADVRTTGDQPQYASLLKDVLVADAAGLKPHGPTTYRLSDGLSAGLLQPSLTYQVVCVWEQETATDAPGQVRLTLNKLTWRTSLNDGSSYWLDPTPVGIVTVGVQPLEGS